MSTTQISFSASLQVGQEIVPLASEIVVGQGNAKDGVQSGFLFKLNLQPSDPPVIVNLGDIIAFVEQKLGAGEGSLSGNAGVSTLSTVFGANVTGPFTSANTTVVNIQEFTINSTTSSTLFSLSVDIIGSDPTSPGGAISLPGDLAGWLQIKDLAIAFCTATAQTPPQTSS